MKKTTTKNIIKPEYSSALNQSIDYLDSDEALKSIKIDPYWPKWNSPWWHMALLHEMGLAEMIPQKISHAMLEAIDSHYLHYFPFTEKDAPVGTDFRTIMCHCGLASMYKIFYACDIEVDEALPWAREWFLKYQMPDGGLNCDEAAYVKTTPKSSMVSTLPALEAIITCTRHKFSEEETSFLDRGAKYIINHKLMRSTNGAVINETWKQLCFPRFYEYDILRGLSFLAKWSAVRGMTLPDEAISESIDIIRTHLDTKSELIVTRRRSYEGAQTFIISDNGSYTSKKTFTTFPLLELVSKKDELSPYLTNEWNEIKRLLSIN
ncbi:MAG TPA: hypothetical protein PKK26_10815 [Candidatus Wallbacteria bacterium]|nr:hypothetical protein [Candidatus Wallbacteria bacterium]